MDVEGLIPHRGPARLVESVLERIEGGLVCRARVPADSPFAAAGGAPAFVGLEMGAQAAAVLEALDRAGGGARVGYLVGVRGARFEVETLPVGAPLVVTVTAAGSAPPLAVYEVVVEEDGRRLLAGKISTYIPP